MWCNFFFGGGHVFFIFHEKSNILYLKVIIINYNDLIYELFLGNCDGCWSKPWGQKFWWNFERSFCGGIQGKPDHPTILVTSKLEVMSHLSDLVLYVVHINVHVVASHTFSVIFLLNRKSTNWMFLQMPKLASVSFESARRWRNWWVLTHKRFPWMSSV